MTTVGAAWRRLERAFREARLHYGHGTRNARDEAAWLVCHVCRIDFDALAGALERPVTPPQQRRLDTLAAKRIASREPLAYLLREAFLLGHRFYVDRRTIVPRSFIAELLPAGLSPWAAPGRIRRVLDLCTGSGCLAILAALAYPSARVDAVDISHAALEVAKRNVAAYRLGERLRLVASDLFAALPDERYDLIISNPPYVNDPAMARLPNEYRHEPRLALAGGRDGLDLVRRILDAAPQHLSRHGSLVLEIGHNRAALERAYPRVPFTWLQTSGGDRYVFLLRRTDLESTPR